MDLYDNILEDRFTLVNAKTMRDVKTNLHFWTRLFLKFEL